MNAISTITIFISLCNIIEAEEAGFYERFTKDKPITEYHIDDEFQKRCLNLTNDYRLKHGVKTVNTDPKLIEAAKQGAKALIECKLAATCKGLKRPENHWYQQGHEGEKLIPVNDCEISHITWYQELKKYNFKQPVGTEAPNFINMIWKDVVKQGCARFANEETKEQLIVCMYGSDKSGPNLRNAAALKNNVLPPKTTKSSGKSRKDINDDDKKHDYGFKKLQ